MGYARETLEKRRNVEMELEAIRRQMDKFAQIGECKGSVPKIEKVPGKDEYVFAPRGTNNAEGAAIQHRDGYEEALRKHAAKHEALMLEAERVIGMAEDATDRTILRDYYCLGMTLRRIAGVIHFDHTAVWRRWNAVLDDLDAKLQQNATDCNGTQHENVV